MYKHAEHLNMSLGGRNKINRPPPVQTLLTLKTLIFIKVTLVSVSLLNIRQQYSGSNNSFEALKDMIKYCLNNSLNIYFYE